MNTKALEERWNLTKVKLEQKIISFTNGDHHYINDWSQDREMDLKHLKTCELYNLNQKFCNSTWY